MFSSITSFFQDLRNDPAGTLVTLAYMAGCILFSLILHECAHGYAALKCGDPTAKWMGRLTLDPRKHLDPLGTVCMIFLRVGWAKPVPINPKNFKNYRRDYIIVSLAGIAVNLAICLISLIISSLLARAIYLPEAVSSVDNRAVFTDIYHYAPAYYVYSGDFTYFGSLTSATGLMYVQRLFLMLAQMNLGLAIFNLIPVPPLDGFRFVDEFVFKGRLSLNPQTLQVIHMIFLVVCLSGGLSGALSTVNSAVFGKLAEWIAIIT